MSYINERRKRQVIPRWKLSSVATSHRETEAHTIVHPHSPLEQEAYLNERVEAWRAKPTIGVAADLVSTAIVLQRYDEAKSAAEYITKHPQLSTPEALRLARWVLEEGPARKSSQASGNFSSLDQQHGLLKKQVQSLRRRLSEFPHNPLGWSDLARAFTALGQHKKAQRAISAALSLVPEHRYLLRSAARLYVHLGDPERAWNLLKVNPATPQDPWLVAAAISTAVLAEMKPGLTKNARQLLDSGRFAPLHVSELAATLATLELDSGSTSRSRKLFRRALEDPTENSVAQAQWAARQVNLQSAIEPHLLRPGTHEATAWENYFHGDLKRALDACFAWLADEPFSTSPVFLGTFLCHLITGSAKDAIELCEHGRKANPTDPRLLNNLSYYLALDDRIEEAKEVIRGITPDPEDLHTDIYLPATYGLIRFRSGDFDNGRALYLKAIEHARMIRDGGYMEAIAWINLAREELRAQTPEALSNLAKAEAAVARAHVDGPGLKILLGFARQLVGPLATQPRQSKV